MLSVENCVLCPKLLPQSQLLHDLFILRLQIYPEIVSLVSDHVSNEQNIGARGKYKIK